MTTEMWAAWNILIADEVAQNSAEITRFLVINEFVEEAGVWLESMRATYPQEPEWFALSARHATNYGDPAEAERWLRRAAELAPEVVALQWELAQFERNEGQANAAYTRLSQLAERVPSSPYGAYGLGQMDLAAGNTAEFKAQAALLQERFPSSPLGFLLAAAIADREGDSSAATKWNEQASARGRFLEPANPWLEAAFAHCYLPYALEIQGSLLRERLRHEEAIALLRRGISLAPERAGLHFEMGNALFEQGAGDDCLAAYHAALRLRPTYAAVYPALAQATERFGGVEAMETAFRHGLVALPDFYYLPLQLGEIELRRGRADQALEFYQRAVRLNPQEIAAWKGYAESARLMDRRDTFLVALDGLVQHFSDQPETTPLAGDAFIRLQEWERVDNLYRALDLMPVDDVAGALADANAAIRAEQLWAGYQGLHQILAVQPQHPTALFNLGNFYCNYGACERGFALFEVLYASLESAPPLLRWRAARSLIQAAASSGDFARGHEVLGEAQGMLSALPGDSSEHQASLDDLFVLLMDAEAELVPLSPEIP